MLQIMHDAERLLEMFCEDCRLHGMTEENLDSLKGFTQVCSLYPREPLG